MDNEEVVFVSIADILTAIDELTGKIGNGEESTIAETINFLANAKEFLVTVDGKINGLEFQLEDTNKRCIELTSANNKLMRKVITSEQIAEEEAEDSASDELTDYFEE